MSSYAGMPWHRGGSLARHRLEKPPREDDRGCERAAHQGENCDNISRQHLFCPQMGRKPLWKQTSCAQQPRTRVLWIFYHVKGRSPLNGTMANFCQSPGASFGDQNGLRSSSLQRAEQSRQPCAQQKGAQQLRLFPAASVQVCQRAHLRSIALRSALKEFELNAEAYSDWSITVLLQMFVVNLIPKQACLQGLAHETRQTK